MGNAGAPRCQPWLPRSSRPAVAQTLIHKCPCAHPKSAEWSRLSARPISQARLVPFPRLQLRGLHRLVTAGGINVGIEPGASRALRTNLCAHAPPPSARRAERYARKDPHGTDLRHHAALARRRRTRGGRGPLGSPGQRRADRPGPDARRRASATPRPPDANRGEHLKEPSTAADGHEEGPRSSASSRSSSSCFLPFLLPQGALDRRRRRGVRAPPLVRAVSTDRAVMDNGRDRATDQQP